MPKPRASPCGMSGATPWTCIKKLEKEHKISKDDHDRFSGDIQKATDAGIAEIDHMLAAKEKEILTV